MGFNAMQPGKVKRADLLFLIAAVIVARFVLSGATSASFTSARINPGFCRFTAASASVLVVASP